MSGSTLVELEGIASRRLFKGVGDAEELEVKPAFLDGVISEVPEHDKTNIAADKANTIKPALHIVLKVIAFIGNWQYKDYPER